jgi:serine/threonine-protein kinase RsbW
MQRSDPSALVHEPEVLGPFEYRFTPSRTVIRLARQVFGMWLERQPGVDVDGIDDLMVAVSELCTNAVTHASGAVGSVALRAWIDCDEVVLEVEDDGDGFDLHEGDRTNVTPGFSEEGGRGLFIVSALTDHISLRIDQGRTIVTCRKKDMIRQPPDREDHRLSVRFRAADATGRNDGRRN